MNLNKFLVKPGKRVNLNDFDPGFTGKFTKDKALEILSSDTEKLAKLQDIMYAQNRYGALGVFQALDGAGKDSIARAVMAKVHHSGCNFVPFGSPTAHELDHTYLWRHMLVEPQRGHFDIWIRSHLEEVLSVKTHQEFLASQHLPDELRDKDIWERRYGEIRNYYDYLFCNGIIVVVIFLHISREKQWEQLWERVDDPKKNWKSSIKDIEERNKYWNKYHRAAEKMLSKTSTSNTHAYIVPADHRWFAKMLIARIFVQELEKLNLCYPKLTKERKREIEQTRKLLLIEKKNR